jgi:DNA polymerase I-like protein with 3'-5' exonuclease and polymerase domains
MTNQINFTFQDSDWTPPSRFPNLKDAKEIAIDLETKDPEIKVKGPGWPTMNGNVIGVSVATEDFKGYYPVAHEAGGNMDIRMVLNWVQDICRSNAIKVFHNASYDIGWLRAHGVVVYGQIADTMIAAALIDENRRTYSLNALSVDYLSELKSEAGLREAAEDWGIDAKGEMYKLPAKFVGPYAEQDAVLTYKLWQRFKTEITRQDLTDVWELEMELLPLLIQMRAHGVRVDLDGAEKLKKEFLEKEKKALFKIKKAAGIDVDIWAARSIAKAFDKLKIPYTLTEKSKEPSFTQNWLTNCKEPIAQLIREAREVNKFHSTFIDSIFKFEHNGRIHAEINQLKGDAGGTVSGRLSYAHPNLQQIPARNKDLGPKIRSLFLPDKMGRWASFDYSQQEPRLVVHYAASIGFNGTEELIQAYENENTDFHQTVADMAGIPRSQAKTINLGIFYGMGKNKLSKELGIGKEQAEQILAEYNQKVPFVKQLANRAMDSADKNGAIWTIKGRKCRFNMWEPSSFGLHKSTTFEDAVNKYGKNAIKRAGTYKSLNRLIQGSAADQVKKAMIECAKQNFIPLIQIHDELCFSIPYERLEPACKQIKKIMEHCIPELKVPSKVDIATGMNWGYTDDFKS